MRPTNRRSCQSYYQTQTNWEPNETMEQREQRLHLVMQNNLKTNATVLKLIKEKEQVEQNVIIKGSWTDEEDDILRALVKKHGAKRWSFIANHLKGRVGKQCRERYLNHLDPAINKKEWTLEEDRLILKMHQECGNQWAKISRQLCGRTANAVKNHWNSTLKRKIEKAKEIAAKNRTPVCYDALLATHHRVTIEQVRAAADPLTIAKHPETATPTKKKTRKRAKTRKMKGSAAHRQKVEQQHKRLQELAKQKKTMQQSEYRTRHHQLRHHHHHHQQQEQQQQEQMREQIHEEEEQEEQEDDDGAAIAAQSYQMKADEAAHLANVASLALGGTQEGGDMHHHHHDHHDHFDDFPQLSTEQRMRRRTIDHHSLLLDELEPVKQRKRIQHLDETSAFSEAPLIEDLIQTSKRYEALKITTEDDDVLSGGIIGHGILTKSPNYASITDLMWSPQKHSFGFHPDPSDILSTTPSSSNTSTRHTNYMSSMSA